MANGSFSPGFTVLGVGHRPGVLLDDQKKRNWNKTTWGWGDGVAGNMLAAPVRGPEFESYSTGRVRKVISLVLKTGRFLSVVLCLVCMSDTVPGLYIVRSECIRDVKLCHNQ